MRSGQSRATLSGCVALLCFVLGVMLQACLSADDNNTSPSEIPTVSEGYRAVSTHCAMWCDGWCEVRCAGSASSSSGCVSGCYPHECIPMNNLGDPQMCVACCVARGLSNAVSSSADNPSRNWSCEYVCGLVTDSGLDAGVLDDGF